MHEERAQQPQKLVTELLRSSKASDGSSLFDHLSLMLSQVPIASGSQQLNNLEHFQMLSDFVKKHRLVQKELQPQHVITQLVLTDRKTKHEWATHAQELSQTAKKLPAQENLVFSNFSADVKLFQWAGVSFPPTVSEHIHQSVKRLAVEVQAKKLRFWGKLLTKTQDYYVAQGVSSKPNNTELQAGMEKQGEGANYYTYWVTHNYLEEWNELPLITPQQLVASKQVKHILTGNLDAPVLSYPTFPGSEKHLLKAQLVRITHTCQVSPKGLYAPTEESPDEVDFAEDFKLPEVTELANLENWVHLNPYLLQQGRGSYYVDPTLPEEQKEQILTDLGTNDPKLERLKAINEDKPPEGSEAGWIARIHGDTQVFNGTGDDAATSSYAVCSLRNLSWPGWLTASTNRSFASIYIGYGLKSNQQLFFPLAPNDLLEEGEDVQEFPQPNPKNPPDELEPDSDEEGKKKQDEA